MTHVKVVLEYLHPWTNSAGLMLAAQQGWYADLGLDVELAVADPHRGDSLEYLNRGETTFAVFPANRLLVRSDQGQPLVGVAAVNHRAMETIKTAKSTGITRPRDLEGRRLAYNPTPRGIAMVRHLVAADGVDPDKVITVDSGARELQTEDILGGIADATFGTYWAWDVLFDPSPEQLYWPVDEIGAPRYHSYLIGTREDGDPGLTRAFLAATARGYLSAISEPERARSAFERYIPYFRADILSRSLDLVAPTWTHDGQWGTQRPELMEPYAAWLADAGILSTADVWQRATTNEFLP
jgi:putative hydroxymethylpyrimidine transport system substrate-binding protein